ncbi:MAG: hypothetical protein MZU95_15570 [Desulfomicrobium escambiense]|nr:hypothetical protein [Desulfomicrobium escambiense]
MGLKARLLLLMTGIAVLPVLSSALLVLLYLRSQYPGFSSLDVSPLELGIRQMETRLAEALAESDFSRISRGSENLSIRVAESETGRIVFERPGPRAGPGADEITIRLSSGGREYSAVFRLGLPRRRVRPLPLPPLLPVAALGTVILFTVLVSLGILRSLGRSMGKLEEATRRIAAGDPGLRALPSPRGFPGTPSRRPWIPCSRRLKEEYQRRDRFILAVSHDLKTPLAVLEGYLDAFADGLADSPDKRESYLKVLREKTGVLGHRISHLVELARMTTVEWRQTLEACDLSAFLAETLGLLSDEAAARGRKLAVDLRLQPARIADMRPGHGSEGPGKPVGQRGNLFPPGFGPARLRLGGGGRGPSSGFRTRERGLRGPPGPGLRALLPGGPRPQLRRLRPGAGVREVHRGNPRLGDRPRVRARGDDEFHGADSGAIPALASRQLRHHPRQAVPVRFGQVCGVQAVDPDQHEAVDVGPGRGCGVQVRRAARAGGRVLCRAFPVGRQCPGQQAAGTCGPRA